MKEKLVDVVGGNLQRGELIREISEVYKIFEPSLCKIERDNEGRYTIYITKKDFEKNKEEVS